jgi:hypothetical protein
MRVYWYTASLMVASSVCARDTTELKTSGVREVPVR